MEYHERGGARVYIVLALLLDLLLLEQGGLLFQMMRQTNKEIQCYIINHLPLCLLGLLPVARNGTFEVRIAIFNAKIVEQQYHVCFHQCQLLIFNLSPSYLIFVTGATGIPV